MSKKILVVDDSESIRELVSLVLEDVGFQILRAADGAEALNHLDGQPINLIVTDLNMPNLDGIALVRNVRAMSNYAGLPIVILTTESQAAYKDEARKAGATAWITKPFSSEKLLAVVNKIIR